MNKNKGRSYLALNMTSNKLRAVIRKAYICNNSLLSSDDIKDIHVADSNITSQQNLIVCNGFDSS